MREKVLNVIGNNLETVIKEDLKNIVTNKKMEKEFLECANYVQTECQFRYCGTAIPFLTVRSTAR